MERNTKWVEGEEDDKMRKIIRRSRKQTIGRRGEKKVRKQRRTKGSIYMKKSNEWEKNRLKQRSKMTRWVGIWA